MPAWYEDLRERYRPDVLRLLLVGESPPDPGKGYRRFFYAPTLIYDNLYRGVAAALYGHEPSVDPSAKSAVLDRLREDGVWLIDAVEEPIDKQSTPVRRREISAAAARLVERVQGLDPTVGVVICHGMVFREVMPAMRRAGIRLLHERPIPFPLGNWRAQFVSEFRDALARTEWSVDERGT